VDPGAVKLFQARLVERCFPRMHLRVQRRWSHTRCSVLPSGAAPAAHPQYSSGRYLETADVNSVQEVHRGHTT
jgi:hypothetical protein